MKIYAETIVYLLAPSSHYTGGPESIHRFAYILRNYFSIDARIMYLPKLNKDPVHINFKSLNLPYVTEIQDVENNIIIVPDYYDHMKTLNNYKNIQKIIWWLSVDFFYSSYFLNVANIYQMTLFKLVSRVNKILNKIAPKYFEIFDHPRLCMKFLKNLNLNEISAINSADVNLVQSEYALNFLKNNNIRRIHKLNDYLGDDVLLEPLTISKANIVTYNPAKGYFFTKKIIDACPEIKFVPIQNLSRLEVIKLLSTSKVYIDFGNHPGRDRLPREAAVLGNCIVTSKRGSAAFFEDIAIPEDCKFDDLDENILLIKQKLRSLFDNYADERLRLSNYIGEVRAGKEIAIGQTKEVLRRSINV